MGSSTINAQMGNTISGRCAIGCSKDNGAHWTKSQAVVMLSRTNIGKNTTIVGNKTEAINIMWSLIVRPDQWTDYTDMLLKKLTINSKGGKNEEKMIFDFTEVYPYHACDIILPTDETGFVYFLISIRDFDKDYIGQTEQLPRQLQQHNSGYGSISTADPYYRPYAIAAYITGLYGMNKTGREVLEKMENISE